MLPPNYFTLLSRALEIERPPAPKFPELVEEYNVPLKKSTPIKDSYTTTFWEPVLDGLKSAIIGVVGLTLMVLMSLTLTGLGIRIFLLLVGV